MIPDRLFYPLAALVVAALVALAAVYPQGQGQPTRNLPPILQQKVR